MSVQLVRPQGSGARPQATAKPRVSPECSGSPSPFYGAPSKSGVLGCLQKKPFPTLPGEPIGSCSSAEPLGGAGHREGRFWACSLRLRTQAPRHLSHRLWDGSFFHLVRHGMSIGPVPRPRQKWCRLPLEGALCSNLSCEGAGVAQKWTDPSAQRQNQVEPGNQSPRQRPQVGEDVPTEDRAWDQEQAKAGGHPAHKSRI